MTQKIDRRALFKQAAFFGGLSVLPVSNVFAGTETKRGATGKEADALIYRRLSEKLIVADYVSLVRCLRKPEMEAPTKEGFEKFRKLECGTTTATKQETLDFAQAMENNRVQGLIRLLEVDLAPSVKILLLNLNLERVMHEVGTCLDHFLGVFEILRRWGHSEEQAYIGLLHAVYGTEFNPITVLDARSMDDRKKLAQVIGPKAERWARIYGLVNSGDFVQKASQGQSSYTVNAELVLKEKEYSTLADALVANTYEPLIADGEKQRVTMFRQFAPVAKYMSDGAKRALLLVDVK